MNSIEKDAVDSIQMKASYDQFLKQLMQRFDPGFGSAPKFPPYAAKVIIGHVRYLESD